MVKANQALSNSALVVIMHALHVCSQHLCGLPLRMSWMHWMKFDHTHLDLLSLVIWSHLFWLSVTWNLRKAQQPLIIVDQLCNHWLLVVIIMESLKCTRGVSTIIIIIIIIIMVLEVWGLGMRLDWIFLPRENPCAKFYIIIIKEIIFLAWTDTCILRTIIYGLLMLIFF